MNLMIKRPAPIIAIHFLLTAVVFLIPIFSSNAFIFRFTTAKTLLLYLLVEVAFTIWLYLLLTQKEYLPLRSPVLMAGAIFLSIYTIAGVFSLSPEVSFFSGMSRMTGLVFLYHIAAFLILLVSTVRDRKTWDKLFTATVLSGAVVAIVSYFQSFSILPVYGATLGNSSDAGTYLMLVGFVSIFMFFKSQNQRERLLFGITSLLIVFSPLLFNFQGLFQAHTDFLEILGNARAASGALIIGLLAAGGFYLANSSRKYVKHIFRAFFWALVAIVVITSAFMIVPNSNIQNIFQQEETGARLLFWRSALEGIQEKPLLGWGPENYFVPHHLYFQSDLLSEEYKYGNEAHSDRIHNLYLKTIIEGGIFALVSYMAIFAMAIRSLFKSYHNGTLTLISFSLFVGLIMAYFIQSTLSFDTVTSYIILALFLAYVNYQAQQQKINGYPNVSRRPHNLYIVIATILGVAVLYVFTYLPYKQQTVLLHILSDVSVSERVELYDDLFAITSQQRTSMAIFLINKMKNTVPDIWRSLNSDEKDLVLADMHSLRMTAEQYFIESPTNYEFGISLVKFLFLEASLQQDIEATNMIVARAERYEKYLRELSPNNPMNGWVEAQIQLFHGDAQGSLDTLEQVYEAHPNVEITSQLIQSVQEYLADGVGVPLLIR